MGSKAHGIWVYLHSGQLASPALVDLLSPQSWHCCRWRPAWWPEYAEDDKMINQPQQRVGDSRHGHFWMWFSYLIYKHALLGWFAAQWENVQVSGGGEAGLHHSNQGLLRDTCDLSSDGCTSITSCSFSDSFFWQCIKCVLLEGVASTHFHLSSAEDQWRCILS